MQKALTDIYNKRDTNPVIYGILREKDFLDIFPTLEEKLNIVKFPEKKFKDEKDIMFWEYLPTNKTIQELLDLYEQLYNGVSPNIESTQNQINNIENNIESQLSGYVNIDIKSKIETARQRRQLASQAIKDREAAYQAKLQEKRHQRQQLTQLMETRVEKIKEQEQISSTKKKLRKPRMVLDPKASIVIEKEEIAEKINPNPVYFIPDVPQKWLISLYNEQPNRTIPELKKYVKIIIN